MKGILLRKTPYKVCEASVKYDHVKIQLNPQCGLTKEDKVFEVKYPNGVIVIIPESIYEEVKSQYI